MRTCTRNSPSFLNYDENAYRREDCIGLPQQRLFEALGHLGAFVEVIKASSQLRARDNHSGSWCGIWSGEIQCTN